MDKIRQDDISLCMLILDIEEHTQLFSSDFQNNTNRNSISFCNCIVSLVISQRY